MRRVRTGAAVGELEGLEGLVRGLARRRWVRLASETGYDVAAWLGGLLMAASATGDLALARPSGAALGQTVACIGVMTAGCGVIAGLYRGRYLRGSRDEVAAVALAGFLTA